MYKLETSLIFMDNMLLQAYSSIKMADGLIDGLLNSDVTVHVYFMLASAHCIQRLISNQFFAF